MRPAARLLLATPALIAALPAAASEDTQYWQTLSLTVALPDSFKVQDEMVFRSGDARGFYELENSLLVGKKVNKKVTVWTGYVFNPLYNHGTFVRREHRLRQQVNIDSFAVIGKVKFSGRVRLETRWREGLAGTGWRLRPQVKASMPLTGKATVTFANETFINLNNTSFQSTDGFDRTRTSLSVGVPLSKKISLDFGYLNQHFFVPNAADNNDHVLTLGLSASI